jgi:flagellar hook-associated protein 2
MGTILTNGIGSGLDIQGLVSQLVAAEGQPQQVRLDTQEARLQTKLSAIGSLRSALEGLGSALDALANPDSFRNRIVSQSSTDFVSVFASQNASFGSYQIEVQQLATVHRLVSGPLASGDTAVGTGTLTLAIGVNGFTVDIDSSNNTLNGIRDAINESALNTGISAAVVTGVDGARLILSGAETGAANQIVVTASGGDGGLAALSYDPGNSITNLTELEAALDASALIEGIQVASASNTITEAIDGVEISLLGLNAPGETTLVTIGLDRDVARAAIDKLVESYNNLIDMITDATRYDADSGTAGPLLGDAGLRNILFQIRREFGALPGNETFGTLADLGITIELDGKLAVDSAALDAALTQDVAAAGALFSDASSGLAPRLSAMLEPYLQTGGTLDARRDGLQTSIDDITDRREALQQRLVALEQRLFRQFNALDGLLAQLQSTSGFLQQQLDSLPGFTTLTNNRRS